MNAKAKAKVKAKSKSKSKSSAKARTPTSKLLAQVLAAPDDDDLAAVYADGLIEAGDPRGAFISEQLALASMSPLDARYAPLLASTRRLEAEHGAAWIGDYLTRSKLAETHAHVRTGLDRLLNAVFERGFLRRIAITHELLPNEWPRLREREPIRGIELLVGEGLDPRLGPPAAGKELTSLKISPDAWFTSDSVGQVLAWGMPELRDLDLSGCDLGSRGAALVASWKRPLRRLALRGTQLRDDGVRVVLAAKHLATLEELDISQCRIDDGKTFDALRAFESLKRLAVAGNAAQLEAIAWPRLEALTLPQTTSADSLRALFPKPSPALHTLDLANAKGAGAAPDAIARAAESFAALDIGTTSMGDANFAKLLAAASLRPLVQLAANGCSLSDASITALTSSKLDRLVVLDLSSNKPTDRALEALAAWPGIAQIANLRLGNNRKLTAAGYEALIEAKGFRPARLDVGKVDAKLREALVERFGIALEARPA